MTNYKPQLWNSITSVITTKFFHSLKNINNNILAGSLWTIFDRKIEGLFILQNVSAFFGVLYVLLNTFHLAES